MEQKNADMKKPTAAMWKCLFVAAAIVASLAGCRKSDKSGDTPAESRSEVPLVIYDTDIGSSTDDLFGLMMLYDYERRGMCRLLGVVVDREGEDCAACADVMNTYFGRGEVPIALVRNGIDSPRVWIDYRGLPRYKLADSSAMFLRSVADCGALPDGWQLYRRLLSAQPDHSVSIVSVGFLACLAQLLQSQGDTISPYSGVELVRRKVKGIYIQGGMFGESEEPDFNFFQGMDFARTFFDLWPREVEMVFSPMEAGNLVEYAPEQVVADIAWTDRHPVKQVYLTCNCRTGQKMWDVLAAVCAVEGGSRFSLSERGTVELTPGGATLFTPSEAGNCRYQMPGSEVWAQAMLDSIRRVAATH